MSALPRTNSQVKPELGETNGDRELLLAALRVATVEAKLVSNTLDTIGIALRQRAVSVADAMAWCADEGIIDLLKFGPPSKTGRNRSPLRPSNNLLTTISIS
jgi:hypothetical protein